MPSASITHPSPAAADPFGNTDELLSQLAGNEIDRLLSEANADIPLDNFPQADLTDRQSVAAEAPAANLDSAAAPVNIASELDALFTELQETSVNGSTSRTSAPEQTSFQDDSEATVVAEESVEEEPATGSESFEKDPPQGEERAAMLKAAGFDDAAPSDEPSTDAETPAEVLNQSNSERSALLAAAGFDAPEAADTKADTAPDNPEIEKPTAPSALAEENIDEPETGNIVTETDDSVPFYLKPLEWLNAPVAHCTPAFRQFLGQAGIVTMITSVAVLTYVWMSHRR
jgi:hypothetical protein